MVSYTPEWLQTDDMINALTGKRRHLSGNQPAFTELRAADPGKRDRIYNMVKSMKEEGVPIDGIGMQGHYNVYGPSMEDVDAALTKYSTIVKHIHITELDIRANQEMGGQLNFSRDGGNISQVVKTLQEDQYARLFKVLRKHKDVVDNVTFWNLSDRDSWLGARNYPLPDYENYKAKRVYSIIKDFDPASALCPCCRPRFWVPCWLPSLLWPAC